MYPAPITDFHRPASPAEAIRLFKRASGTAMYIAGGMSLMQAVKSRFLKPDCLIDLNDIKEMRQITRKDGAISLGAMMRYCDLAKEADQLGPYRIFSDAAAHVGDRQVRHRGTIGGSLCWNYVAACTPVAALAAGAEVDILRATGWRKQNRIPIGDFLGSPMETALKPGDLLTAIHLPAIQGRAGSAYRKWGILKDSLPVVGIGVMLHLDDAGVCTAARVAVGGLANGSERLSAAETVLAGQPLDDGSVIADAAHAGAKAVAIQEDPWTSIEYRRRLVAEMIEDVTRTALNRAQEG